MKGSKTNMITNKAKYTPLISAIGGTLLFSGCLSYFIVTLSLHLNNPEKYSLGTHKDGSPTQLWETIVFICVFVIFVVGFATYGIYSFVKAHRHNEVIKKGIRKQCVLEKKTIVTKRVGRGSATVTYLAITVSYYDENGDKHTTNAQVPYFEGNALKIDMELPCFVYKDRCVVDYEYIAQNYLIPDESEDDDEEEESENI